MKRTCRLCSGREFTRLLTVENANFTSRVRRFDIVRCTTCGLAMMDPFPTAADVEELYRRDNTFSQPYENPYRRNLLFPILEPIYRHYGDGRHFIVRNCMRHAPRHRPVKILDIGCSTGSLLQGFRDMAKRVDPTGIDIDPMARANAPVHLRDAIVIGDVLSEPLDGPYDVITMEMVIEHLLDPVAYIRRCHELLRPGGVLMLSTPDIDSVPARKQGANWWLVNRPSMPVGHVVWFNRRAMEYTARAYGFRVARIKNRGNLVPYLPDWLRRTLERLLGFDAISGRFIRWYPVRILWALIVTGWLSGFLSKGEYVYAFLVKESDERQAQAA
ncbi:MAG: class I SAM-dependent methyltransferase [Kiloniellales bacterium]